MRTSKEIEHITRELRAEQGSRVIVDAESWLGHVIVAGVDESGRPDLDLYTLEEWEEWRAEIEDAGADACVLCYEPSTTSREFGGCATVDQPLCEKCAKEFDEAEEPEEEQG